MNLQDTINLHAAKERGWYGFDLDGTLAEWHDGDDPNQIGKLIDGEATKKLRQYLKQGKLCKIVTARVGGTSSSENAKQAKLVQSWAKKKFGKDLEVTNGKDAMMIELYDDKAKQVEENTGRIK